MDLSRVLGEFYDEQDDLAPGPVAAERGDLAAALSEAVAEPDVAPDPVAGDREPDDPEPDDGAWPPAPDALAGEREPDDDSWPPAPETLVAASALGLAEEPAEAVFDEPAPSWHRGDDDVLPPRRKGLRVDGGWRRS